MNVARIRERLEIGGEPFALELSGGKRVRVPRAAKRRQPETPTT